MEDVAQAECDNHDNQSDTHIVNKFKNLKYGWKMTDKISC